VLGLSLALGAAGALAALALSLGAPWLLCADEAVRGLMRRTAGLSAASVLLLCLNHGLYGVYIGYGWLPQFLVANMAGSVAGLAALARVPAGAGVEGLLRVWRIILTFTLIKVAVGALQLPMLLRRHSAQLARQRAPPPAEAAQGQGAAPPTAPGDPLPAALGGAVQ
jgi:hypothetical protein